MLSPTRHVLSSSLFSTTRSMLTFRRHQSSIGANQLQPYVEQIINAVDPAGAQTAAATTSTSSPATPPLMQIPPEADPTLELFTNCVMRHGQKHRAATIVSRMLLHLHTMTRCPPVPIFRQAISMASPSVRIRSQKTRGKVMQKPEALSEKQRTRFAIRWIIERSVKRDGQDLAERLARECVAVVAQDSAVLKEKEKVHALAVANRSGVGIRV